MDKSRLFQGYLEEEDVELPGDKGTVRVRALTRLEMEQCANAGKKGDKDPRPIDVEIMMVVLGMVDPEIDINDAKLWARTASVGEWRKVTKKISELSEINMTEDEEKQAINDTYADFRE